MWVKKVHILPSIEEKILAKHGSKGEEIREALGDGNPLFRRVGGNQYVAMGCSKSRYLTVFFKYDKKTKEAEITTAYPSTENQIRFYRKIRK